MQAPLFFAEAEMDYRHEQLMRQVRQTLTARRPLAVKVREARQRWTRRGNGRPAVRQPVPAPHHMGAAS